MRLMKRALIFPFRIVRVQIEGLQMDKVKTIFESNAKHPEPNSSNL